MSTELSLVGKYIQHHLQSRLDDEGYPWSQTKLASLAGLSNDQLSMVMEGVLPPEESMLKQIAAALGIDDQPLLGLAGLPGPVEAPWDEETAYDPQRLATLPPNRRRRALNVLGARLDLIYQLAGITPPEGSNFAQDNLEVEEQIEALVHLAHGLRDVESDETLPEGLITGGMVELLIEGLRETQRLITHQDRSASGLE